uniref:Anti-Mullerian hormone n=1 Tax=Cyanistes caeruleus TaxID=156563 RepID=A0A8C0VTS9_CYACU
MELSLLEELGLEAEGRKVGNGSLQETPRSRRAAATLLFSKPEPGAECPPAEEGGPGWSRSSPQPWPLGGLEGPVCRVRMEQDGATPRHLEVVGVLSHYESSFIKLLRRRRSWDGNFPGTFGLCRAGEAAAAPHPLQRIHEHVLEPGRERFLVLHLEEGWWESPAGSEVEQRGEGCGAQGGDAVCWPKREVGTGGHPGDSSSPALVPSLGRLGSSQAHERRWGHAGDPRPASSPLVAAAGAPLPRTEVQQLLFGSDDKCFTRMTPVLLLLAKSRPPQAGTEELPTPTAPSQANTSSPAPGGSAQFLAILTRFIRQLLSSSSEPPPQPSAHHWLDFEAMETLPHQLLNLSEEAALERLVQSEEPSVLLLAQDSGAGWPPVPGTLCPWQGRSPAAPKSSCSLGSHRPCPGALPSIPPAHAAPRDSLPARQIRP